MNFTRKYGYWIFPMLALILAACAKPAEHNPTFVGQWESGLPVPAAAVPTNLSRSDQMNRDIQKRVREMNAAGDQGVELVIRADGTFTLRLWMSMPEDMFKSLGPDSEARKLAQQPKEHSVDGTWESEDDTIFLRSKSGFLPYAFTEKTRIPSYHSRYGGRADLVKTGQLLPLHLRSNGRLSQFPDENVRPGTHETALDFTRVQ